jgi:anti-anti-sigma factor
MRNVAILSKEHRLWKNTKLCNNRSMPDFGPPPEILTVIEIDPATGFALVSCRGRLVASHTDEFYNEVRQLIPGAKRIVLDFNDVTHMDSWGLGVVLRLYVSAKKGGCELQLANLSKAIWKIFSVTNVLSFFTIVGENDIRML